MIKNDYKELEHILLLFAILISDDEPTERRGMNKYYDEGAICVYDMEDNERLVGVFNKAETCSRKLNINETYIVELLKPLKKELLYKKRYRFRRVKI